jgi:dolichyl-diphosphooligosaccharide--protein glycosyltransferase
MVYLYAFPSTVVHDFFQGFPEGTGILNSPTMEYLLAVLLFPFRSHPSIEQFASAVVALVPALIGATTVVVFYRLAASHLGQTAALGAACVLAFAPQHIMVTIVGRFDSEMVEPLLMLLVFGAYLRTYNDGAPSWRNVGVLSFVYLAFWRGALVPLAVIGVDVLARVAVRRRGTIAEPSARVDRSASQMYGITALLLAGLCLSNIWGTRDSFTFNIISWFHVVLFGAAGLSVYLLGALLRQGSRVRLVSAVAGLLAVGLAIALFRAEIEPGLRIVMGGSDAWLESIEQYRRFKGLGEVVATHGALALVAPLALLALRSPALETLTGKRFLTLWCLWAIALGLARTRYGHFMAVASALLAGLALCWIGHRLKSFRPPIRNVVWTSCLLALLGLQYPVFTLMPTLVRSGIGGISRDVEQTMLWLRDHTPRSGDPFRPEHKPTYGVLARWDYGAWIESIAMRPSIATHGGTETYGMQTAARFFLEADDAAALRILSQNQIRYVVADKIFGDLPMYATLIDAPNLYVENRVDPVRQTTTIVARPALYSLVIARLFFADGGAFQAGAQRFEPVPWARLVYESASPANVLHFPRAIKRLKVFERVTGALLRLHGSAGQLVSLAVPIETNQGRQFVYRQETRLGEDGTAELKLPYGVREAQSTTGAIGPVVLVSGDQRRKVVITDKDVITGTTKRVVF